MNKKIIYIIPGYRHKPANKAYKEIAKILKNEGYSPVLINISWKQTTISENTRYFLKEYKKINSRKKYILGFSYGAMIAFLASTKVAVSGLILCSLSPYFKEDFAKTKNKLISSITVNRYEDFLSLESTTLVKQIKAKKILLLYGVKEAKPLIKRVNETYDQILSLNKYLIPIKETDHNIGDRRYLNTIHQVAKGLN
ncbi:hypothetical protein C4559_04405 [Candidatus Microgenomates bacterium]|nr:MAG: hypothetical protein C4559_04405 [Candidatus Microgenomates bacterium]